MAQELRNAIVIGLLLVSAAAAADRTTVLTLGGSMGMADRPYDGAPMTGGRLLLSWEDGPLAFPIARDVTSFSGRLVPELFAGFLGDDVKAEGMLGAGLRAELATSTLGRWPFYLKVRGALYVAARGEVIGKDRDPAGELVFGEYLWLGGGRARIGGEGGVIVWRYLSSLPMTDHEAILTLYVSWAL